MRTLTIVTAGGQKYTSADPQVVATYLSQGADVLDELGKRMTIGLGQTLPGGNHFAPGNIWLNGVPLLTSNPPVTSGTGQVVTNAIPPVDPFSPVSQGGGSQGAGSVGAAPRAVPMVSGPTTTPLKGVAAAATIVSLVRFFL